MNVDAILKVKGDTVVTIGPTATLAEAVEALCRHRIGALVVSANGTEPQGILSERDIVQALGNSGASLLQRRGLQLDLVEAVLDDVADADDAAEPPFLNHREMSDPAVRHLGH